MVVKVEDISIGAKFDDIIWNYWVTFKLSDETLLTVFDENCLSSNFEEKSFISVKLKALFVQKKEKEDLTKFEGMIFKKDMDYFFKNDLVKIKVDKDNINDEKIPLNTTLVLFFGRIDLIDSRCAKSSDFAQNE